MARIEMLNDNAGHTALGRQSGEQFGNRLEAARRGSHGYDRSCHMALLGATHPALDGTTTVVVGQQYRPSRASKRRSGCDAQRTRCTVGQERFTHAAAPPPATGQHFKPIQSVECAEGRIQPSGPARVGGATRRTDAQKLFSYFRDARLRLSPRSMV